MSVCLNGHEVAGYLGTEIVPGYPEFPGGCPECHADVKFVRKADKHPPVIKKKWKSHRIKDRCRRRIG